MESRRCPVGPLVVPRSLWCLLMLVVVSIVACGSDDQGSTRIEADTIADADGGVQPGDISLIDSGADGATDALPVDVLPDGDEESDADGSGELDGGEGSGFPSIPVAVNTILSATTAPAGTTVIVNCQGLDEEGQPLAFPVDTRFQLIAAPSGSVTLNAVALELVPTRTGTLEVACSVPTLGMTDDSPAELEVTPGPPFTMVATLDQDSIEAGEFVEVSCTALDEFGNLIPEQPFDVTTNPGGSGVEVDRQYVVVIRADVYEVRCDTEGAAEAVAATLEVTPGLPATVALGLIPERRVYGVGEVVELVYTVADEYGNLIADAPVSFGALPGVPSFGEGRFRFDAEGTFRLQVFVGLPTATGSPLIAGRKVTVNSEGPAIVCDRPSDGAFVNQAPGSLVEFRGRVNDVFGANAVVVNGVPASLSADGVFTARVTSRFGINFVQVDATDTFGETSRRTCAFLLADVWSSEGAFLPAALTLGLQQNAFDDGNRFDGLDSINDLLYTALNGAGVRNALNSALQSANPLYDQCVQRVCIFGCFCALSLSVNHQDTSLRGPNDTVLTLVDGGLRASGDIRGLGLRIRIGGTFSTNGWVNFDQLGVDLTFNVSLSGGRPRVTLRSINDVRVGRVDTDFSGLTGFIIDIIVDLFQGTIRNLIRDTVRDYIQDSFNDILDGVVGGLNVDNVGQTFDVDRFDGSGTSTIGFGIQFGQLDVTPARALFTINTRLTSTIIHEGFTLGAPVPPGSIRYEPSPTRSVAAGISIGVFNQALHALWRGGLLDLNVAGSALSEDIPDDAIAAIRTNLPPVIAGLDDNSITAHLGAVQALVVIPGIIDAPLDVELGGVAASGFDLLPGDVIQFRDIEVTELYFSPQDQSLTVEQTEALEELLLDLVRYLVDESINSALPALPIPDFELPASLAEFGFTPGTRLGLVAPRLFVNQTHFVAEGNFGER